MKIILRLELSDDLLRALAQFRHGRRGGRVKKEEAVRWVSGIVDQAITDMEFRLQRKERGIQAADPD